MASGQAVWGLDVGKCALKALKLRPGPNGNVELLAADYIEHERILSQPDADREALLASALETFLARNDIADAAVVVSVPGQHTLARFSKLPPVEAKKIAEIVRYEAEQQIPFDMDEVIWDYQTFQEPDTPDVEVGIFAMKRDLIRDHLLHYENVGIEPAVVQSAPLAVYNGAHFDGLLSPGKITVLLDIGAENTDLIMASSHGLWTRTIPLGGNSFTSSLVTAFKLSFGKAENLKRSAATSKYARQIFQAMRPVFADLVQELQRSIGFYTSTHRDADLTVVGLGNAFKLPGLQKYLQQNLGMEVRRPDKFAKLAPAEGVNAAALQDNALSFAVAYGLAVQGLRQSMITTNLLPAEIARAVVWRKKRPFFGAAAACLLLTAGAIWIALFNDTRTLSANEGAPVSITDPASADRIIEDGPPGATSGERARHILAAAREYRQEYAALENQGQDELRKIDDILALYGHKELWFKILDVIHAALPQPPEELGRAEGPEAYRAAIEAADDGRLDRKLRTEIYLEALTARFEYNLDHEDLIDEFEDLSGEIGVEEVEGQDREGFLIRLSGRTPHKDQVAFVTQFFKKPLRQLGRRPGQGFYINRIWLTEGEVLAPSTALDDPSKTAPSASSRVRGPRPRGRTGRPPAPGSTGQERADELIDPVTDEVMNSDWQFKLVFDVVLEDLPEPAEGEGAGETDGPAGRGPE